MQSKIAALEATVASLTRGDSTRTSATQQAVSKCAALNERVDAIQQQLRTHATLVAQATAASKALATTAATAAPTPSPPAFQRFRLTPVAGASCTAAPPSDHLQAMQAVQQLLQELSLEFVKPAELYLHRPKPAAASSSQTKPAPSGLVVGFMPTDAYTLKSKLWDLEVQRKVSQLGWRITRVLPAQEFGNKQALWKKHGACMRAWVTQGKRLLYSKQHRAVTAEGVEGAPLSLP
jgi:hypothetical protein